MECRFTKFVLPILKHDISVLESSQIPTVKFSFDPKDFKADTANLLNIIQNKPTSLYGKLFWLPEIENLAIEKDLTFIQPKATADSSDPGLKNRWKNDKK
jgi:hypothetical protein